LAGGSAALSKWSVYFRPRSPRELGIVNELAEDARERAREVAEGLRRLSPVSVTAAKRSIVRGANLPIEEGLQIEGEEWLKTIVTEDAMRLMRDYVAQPFEKRREWIRTHGVPPVKGQRHRRLTVVSASAGSVTATREKERPLSGLAIGTDDVGAVRPRRLRILPTPSSSKTCSRSLTPLMRVSPRSRSWKQPETSLAVCPVRSAFPGSASCSMRCASPHGVPLRRIVHAEIVADLANDDLARVQAKTEGEVDPRGDAQLIGVLAQAIAQGERRVAGALRVVFMRDRRSEKGHDAVARVLVHLALEAVDAVGQDLEEAVQDLVPLFGVDLFGELHRALHFGEQHGHLIALAFEGGA
jgi:hypothetical protein